MSAFDRLWTSAYRDGLIATGVLVVVVLVASIIERVIFRLLLRLAQRRQDSWFAMLLRHVQAPAAFAVPLFAAALAVPDLRFSRPLDAQLTRGLEIGTIVAAAWGIVGGMQLYADMVKRRYALDVPDNLHARQVATRIDILTRTAVTLVVVVAAALAAMTFPTIRALGTTLLASAGVAGLAVGLAARPFFANLVAGVQIALTQPIRIDDAVTVQNEFGHIEEIGGTYVVVRLWDRRRLLLPLTYFIEQPFTNWTRTRSALVGAVTLFAPLDLAAGDLRAELPKMLQGATPWDGDVQEVRVVDMTETAQKIEVRVSAASPTALFDLCCRLREQLIAWLAERRPKT